jgi:hypothetical protein
MMVARRGWAVRVSLVKWYVGALLVWLAVPMWKGVAERGDWSDPVFIVFSLLGLSVSLLALDSTMLIVASGDTLHVIGLLRRTKFRRGACRFIVWRVGRLRSASHTLLLTDGQKQRQIGHYWMWGDFLAARAAERLEKSLLEK